MRKKYKKYKDQIDELSPWLIGAGLILSASWTADTFFELLNVWFQGWAKLLFPFFFAAMLVLLYRKKGYFRPFTKGLANQRVQPRNHLILFLSNMDPRLESSDYLPSWLELSSDLDKDLQKMEELKKDDPGKRWLWEMPLRGIRAHLPRLETVTLVCSHQSLRQAPYFLSLCQKYRDLENINFHLSMEHQGRPVWLPFKNDLQLESFQGLSFESFDDLSEALGYILARLRQDKVPESEVMIDFTGGKKVTSVVAAAMTFGRQIKAQYVDTESLEVLTYDIKYATGETGEFGL